MENLLLPSKVEFMEGATPNSGTVIVTPCFHGYGTTLGNSLRRVMLSSLSGAAVEAFKIKGVQHEFSAIDGVKEDVVEVMLNLKQLAVKVFGDEPVVLNLSKKGAGKVTGKDIAANANVEIMNKDLVICETTGSKTLEMEIIVGRGRGFKPVEEKDRANYDLGTIIIDSIYTPIRDVGYRVEYTRMGDITNYEKLSLNIETNGTISPVQALEQANQILMDHFKIVQNAVDAQISGKFEAAVKVKEEIIDETAGEETDEKNSDSEKSEKKPKAIKAKKAKKK
ncbi:MAG: DNA-directed RNA polymerase subunit alpha [Candidatus Magasanikbacteria bacterium]